MKYEEMEQIPEGMMERVEKRLAEHLVLRRKRRKTGYVVLLAVLVLILPISVGASVIKGWAGDWGWRDSMEIAAQNGKSVILDTSFEYKQHTIQFEKAVWEEDTLLISYSIADPQADDAVIPSVTSLVNEDGVSVSRGGGTEYKDNGKGLLTFNFDNDDVSGKKLYLRVHTVRDANSANEKYLHEITLDKDLEEKGSVELDYKLPTEYGTLEINRATYENGSLRLGYHLEEAPEWANLKNSSPQVLLKLAAYDISPKISLKDAENNIVRSSRKGLDVRVPSGEIYFDGMPKALDKPILVSVTCAEHPVQWNLPVDIAKPEIDMVNVNRQIKLDRGTFEISKLYLGSASTYLDYTFVPKKNSEILEIRPLLWLETGSERYDMLSESSAQALSGRMICKYPFSEKEIQAAALKLMTVIQTVRYEKNVEIVSQEVPFKFDIQGVQAEVSSMRTENGKTVVKIEVRDTNRKFYDFNAQLKTKNNAGGVMPLSGSMVSRVEAADKNREKLLMENPHLAVQKDVTDSMIEKTFELDGEFDEVSLEIQSLVYIDVVQKEIKIK